MSETVQEPIVTALEKASADLLYSSESDFPLTPYLWKKETLGATEINAASLLKVLKLPQGTPVETVTLEDFFDPVTEEEDWFGEEEKKMAQGFQHLVQTLKTQMKKVTVYKVGKEAKKAVYIVGKTPAGDFAGVSTFVVET